MLSISSLSASFLYFCLSYMFGTGFLWEVLIKFDLVFLENVECGQTSILWQHWLVLFKQMLNMKLRRPNVTATIWSSGKVTCTGASRWEELFSLSLFAAHIVRLPHVIRFLCHIVKDHMSYNFYAFCFQWRWSKTRSSTSGQESSEAGIQCSIFQLSSG